MTVDDLRVAVSVWAKGEPLVRRAYLFGSRAKGMHRADSDADIALIHDCDPDVLASCDGVVVGRWLTWMDFSRAWNDGLQARLAIPLHLQPVEKNDAHVVWPALKLCRIRLYQRGVEFIEQNGGGPGVRLSVKEEPG